MLIEEKIIEYISNYFTKNELEILKKNYHHDYGYDDTTLNDLEYIQLSSNYKKLCNINDPDNKYRVEVDICCSSLIEKLINYYISKDTFIITTTDEYNYIKEYLSTDNIYKFSFFDDNYNTYEECFNAYKKSGCKNIFVLVPSIVNGSGFIIPQQFFNNLKYLLIKHNIPHILCLDDCQGIVYNSRDYNIFDCILATAHVLFLGFDMGILFTKLTNKIGFVNKTGLKRFYEKLEILSKNKEKAKQFNSLLNMYFANISNNIKPYDNTIKTSFNININNNIKLPLIYSQKLYNEYLFTYNNSKTKTNKTVQWFRIRFHEVIIQDPKEVISGLKKVKKVLKLLERHADILKDSLFKKEKSDIHDHISYKILDNFYHFKDDKIINQTKLSLLKIMKNNLNQYQR